VARGLSPPPKDVPLAKPPHRKQVEQPSPTTLKILVTPLSARLVLETDDWTIVSVYDSNYETIGSLLCWILFINCDSWVCSLMSSRVRRIGNFSLWLIQWSDFELVLHGRIHLTLYNLILFDWVSNYIGLRYPPNTMLNVLLFEIIKSHTRQDDIGWNWWFHFILSMIF
jgi:hypothetical protein